MLSLVIASLRFREQSAGSLEYYYTGSELQEAFVNKIGISICSS